MDKWRRRTVYYSILLTGLMLGYAVLYHHGMRIFEGDDITFLHSLQVVVETFTTTGFGSDAPWQSPEMNAFVILMDLTGVAVIFMALPVLVFPLLEDVFSTTVPKSIENGLSDHVVICSYTPRTDALIAELDSWGVGYVLVEPDRERATELYEDDYTVIHGDPESTEGLERAGLVEARALVADVSDQVDASIVLTAQEVAEEIPIVSVVEEPNRTAYHRLAGADTVLSPRPLLGKSLASKVTTSVTSDLDGAIDIGGDIEVAELPIHRGSRLAGTTLAESGIRERAGVNVIGAWFRGEFESPPAPEAVLTNGTVLLVTGREDQLARLKELTLSEIRRLEHGETIVVGYGQVGRTIAGALAEAGFPYTVVDRTAMEGVDVVGDATDPETLEAADIDEARSIILALPDDTAAEFATLVVRDLSPQTEIVARVEEAASTQKMYRAGADYVLSLATVSGRMIASTILEDEDVLSLDQQVEVVRTSAPKLTGQTLGDAQVRSETGCTVVGVERDGRVVTDLGPEFRIELDDEVIIAGTDEGIQRFTDFAHD
ncbi:Trk K+ transport system, NAD-binding component [Halogranum amylolyticum]|uniref:Trk K+ transport system, NAD-binding component n=1 Tax=Halogranum amylolyticum TaxID=660520 RepID=A0A1H8N052_9EURY|nr:NAD-binding protein [Halogranum amylolyticum]SEO22987.1 Trk K+ transport system, NAD-binding component [Halogranum amylolyticum]